MSLLLATAAVAVIIVGAIVAYAFYENRSPAPAPGRERPHPPPTPPAQAVHAEPATPEEFTRPLPGPPVSEIVAGRNGEVHVPVPPEIDTKDHGRLDPPASSEAAGEGSYGPVRVSALRFDAAGRTNGGTHGENADGYLIQDGLLVLADGVTMATASRHASALALGTVAAHLPQKASDPITALTECVEHANRTLLRVGRDTESLVGMATTLDVVTLCRIDDVWMLAWAHVGNAAIWVFPDPSEEGHALTTPHSFGHGPLLRAVGAHPRLLADVAARAVTPGTLVVMATDGLTDVLSFDDVRAAARRHAHDPPYMCADALLAHAYDRRTRDDTTVLVARVSEAWEYVWR